jgi:2-iminoacetate synthase ThiH
MLKAILGFLFGTQAQIFDKEGRVEHQFPKKKWEDWNNRLKANPEYDFKQHSGFRGKAPQSQRKSH